MATVAIERPTLPVPVLEQPHWRVNFRPDEYDPQLIPSPAECFGVVERTSVRFRGWPYPYLSNRQDERHVRANGVEAWTENEYATEYWRFYQSGQFLHLFTFEGSKPRDANRPMERGFVYIYETLFTITEMFEFATRLCQRDVYRGNLTITIGLKDIKDFILLPGDPTRHWPYRRSCVSHESDLDHSRSFPSVELIANSADRALDAAIWFFERFGWESPSKDSLGRDQREMLGWRNGS